MDIVSVGLGGLHNAAGALEKAAGRIAKAEDPVAVDAIDLSSEMVSLLNACQQFQANARVIQTGDDMRKTALNLLA